MLEVDREVVSRILFETRPSVVDMGMIREETICGICELTRHAGVPKKQARDMRA